MKKYVGAIDQGTTSTRFVIFDKIGQIVSMYQLEHKQIYQKPGWVEHDPIEIKEKTNAVIKGALEKKGIKPEELASIGITNQRETTVIWNKNTGKPYYNAIVWQDTRTDELCKKLSIGGDINCFRHKVGLPFATYFSGPKIRWILDNIEGVKQAAEKGDAVFGNIDSWLIWCLTGGSDNGVHVTDVTNASRTMLMNLETLDWDGEMCDVIGVPKKMLPEIKSSSEIYGYTDKKGVFGVEIPVAGDLGDQQAALFGQTCFEKGDAKNTYGTGCFLLVNTGETIVNSKYGLITTPAYKIGNQPANYALEGSIAIAGALVQWFRDNIGLIQTSQEIEAVAKTVEDNGGIYFVPAFSGLFAPHWKSDARGLIIGLTHYINRGHIARAILEATAFQTKEIFLAMEKDSGIKMNSLKADGGMVVNNLLMQFQSDILGVPVICPKVTETTVLGAAYAAGIAVGFWENKESLIKNWEIGNKWQPNMDEAKRNKLYEGWLKAVKRTFAWI
ncbi:MAG: glycerol kinase GlpK [Desulfobacterales bacterium]|nr:glycerol kinase GlpK [Desulfobacterales bacterium]